MLNQYDVAEYFIQMDTKQGLFNTNLIERNGNVFYEGNARLNKYMHLAQNIYLAMTDELLIDTSFYAYDNGAVIPEIQKEYRQLLDRERRDVEIPADEGMFLKKIYYAFMNADIDEIIAIDHEDAAWGDKCKGYRLLEQRMDTLAYKEEYKEQYADMIKILERMEI